MAKAIKRRAFLAAAFCAPLSPYVNRSSWADPYNTVTPKMFADIGEMFSASSAKISIPSGYYEFSFPIRGRPGARIESAADAAFVPTFQMQEKERKTPLIELGENSQANILRLELKAGINNVRTGIKLSGGSRFELIECHSEDLNNNRTAYGANDLESGAVLISGTNVLIGKLSISRFDAGWAVIDSDNITIHSIQNLETIRGGYSHGTKRLSVLSGLTTGPKDPTEPNSFVYGRGIMTPGANSLLLAGCSDSTFANWRSVGMLEHAIRVGRVATGTDTPNHRISFRNVESYRPYGCGFKCDDADDFNIKDLSIDGLYTEDVGNDNWFNSNGYENWSLHGKSNPEDNNDGNKVACAIRNCENVDLANVRNRAKSNAFSGHYGLWIERSRNVRVNSVDMLNAVQDGIVIQSGGRIGPQNIRLENISTSENGGSGLKLDATPSSATWRNVSISGLVSDSNVGAGIELTNDRDGRYPFNFPASNIEGYALNNGGGSIDDAAVSVSFGALKININDTKLSL